MVKFLDYYRENKNWMDYPEVNVKEQLLGLFPEYYTDQLVNLELLKQRMVEGDKKAREFFKCLYKMPYVTSESLTEHADLQNIIDRFGNQIIAHGVEEMKGGMYNLLSMCVSGSIEIQSSGWGALVNGLPNISPVSHGPYYIIYSTTGGESPSNPQISEIQYILVPFQENIDILTAKLEQMVTEGFITQMQSDVFQSKLITYQSLNVLLMAAADSQEAEAETQTQLSSPSANSFFQLEGPSGSTDDTEEKSLMIGM